jgi:hypothetical protein
MRILRSIFHRFNEAVAVQRDCDAPSIRYDPPMRWLVHGTNTTQAVADALRRHQHDAKTLTDIGLRSDADAKAVLEAAKKQQIDILTTDPALAQAPFDLDFWFNRSIVFLQLEGGDVEQDDAVDRLFVRYKRLTPGRLYTVTGSRVKIRQLPSRK